MKVIVGVLAGEETEVGSKQTSLLYLWSGSHGVG